MLLKLLPHIPREQLYDSSYFQNNENQVVCFVIDLDYFGRNKISSGGDLSHYSSASLY